jgi:hypothetical protein
MKSSQREPFWGPGAASFLVIVAAAAALKLVVFPLVHRAPPIEFIHQDECGATPPPDGFVIICQSSARP